MGDAPALRRTLGLWSVVAFAVTNQIGAGLFFVSTQVQSSAPGVGDAVPWLMLAGGAIALVIVAAYRLLLRDGAVGAGGEYAMLARTLGTRVAFCATFLAWFGVTGALGALALTSVRFLENGLAAVGFTSLAHAVHAPVGTACVGLALIWGVWALHVRGIALAGRVALASGVVVLVLALGIAAYAASFPTDGMAHAIARHLGVSPAHLAAPSRPLHAIVATDLAALALLFFSYVGIATATQTGDETRDAARTVPRALLVAVAIVTTVYVALNLAIYHAVPWSLVAAIGGLRDASASTSVTGLVTLVVPPWAGVVLSLVTAFVVAKTIVPLFLAQSRWVYAWAADDMIPSWFARIAPRFGTPVTALTIGAVVGSIALLESIAFGFAFGVAMRVFSAMVVLLLVGIAVARGTHARRVLGTTLAAIALALIGAIVAASRTAPFYAQPAVQAVVVLGAATLVVVLGRRGERTSERG